MRCVLLAVRTLLEIWLVLDEAIGIAVHAIGVDTGLRVDVVLVIR